MCVVDATYVRRCEAESSWGVGPSVGGWQQCPQLEKKEKGKGWKRNKKKKKQKEKKKSEKAKRLRTLLLLANQIACIKSE